MHKKNDADNSLTNGGPEESLRQIRSIVPADDEITSDVLRQLRDGDHECYKKVYLHWRKPIFGFVFSLTGSEAEADDITQDIFTILWNYKERIDPERRVNALLFQIAKRLVANSYRSQQVRKKYADSIWMDESDYFTSHDIVVEKEAELLKNALLERMPPQQRKIFEMSHTEGLTPEEIAARLGIKRETVYNQLSRARKEIRDAVLLMLLAFMEVSSDDTALKIIDTLLS
ncbi:sigma-70 family RNA polymerase sigma factor [Alistipes sp. OttesenSCG-928-B03]|nr:sigma-70 family RNA polymerase sigma factor [Alistipes sp. OttesenSCG-928-B03]